jgi:hypothetical protein
MAKSYLKGSDDIVELLGLLGFWTVSTIWYSKAHNRTKLFRKWNCFCPQVRGRETPTLLGPFERANLSHWAVVSIRKG